MISEITITIITAIAIELDHFGENVSHIILRKIIFRNNIQSRFTICNKSEEIAFPTVRVFGNIGRL